MMEKKQRKEANIKSGIGTYQWLKKNNYPKDNFQILCFNCNMSKGFHGFCHHQFIRQNNICSICNIILNNDNQFNFYIKSNVNLCKVCVLNRSVKKTHAEDEIKKYRSLSQRRKEQKYCTLSLRQKLIEGYGSKCECCNENNYMFLSIDHINNDGAEERKLIKGMQFYRYLIKNNFPKDNYRLLCYNCNCCRYAYEECYHVLCKKLNISDISISEYKDIIIGN